MYEERKIFVNIVLSKDYDKAVDKAVKIAKLLRQPWLIEELKMGGEGFYVLPLPEEAWQEYIEKKAEAMLEE